MLKYNKNLKENARRLRKNLTKAEVVLWLKLKNKQLNGLQFYRQKPIGNYIVDFYCSKAKLVLELDGGQHYSDEGKSLDEVRNKFLDSVGLKVLRFSNNDVMNNIEGVIKKIESTFIEIISENKKIPPTRVLEVEHGSRSRIRKKSPLPPFFKGG
ncbi:MAG: hypothetical protein HW421_3837 [Ignavibacteria bacterium]|nr:hypothetical protein [Ignavibacteria bacterium]